MEALNLSSQPFKNLYIKLVIAFSSSSCSKSSNPIATTISRSSSSSRSVFTIRSSSFSPSNTAIPKPSSGQNRRSSSFATATPTSDREVVRAIRLQKVRFGYDLMIFSESNGPVMVIDGWFYRAIRPSIKFGSTWIYTFWLRGLTVDTREVLTEDYTSGIRLATESVNPSKYCGRIEPKPRRCEDSQFKHKTLAMVDGGEGGDEDDDGDDDDDLVGNNTHRLISQFPFKSLLTSLFKGSPMVGCNGEEMSSTLHALLGIKELELGLGQNKKVVEGIEMKIKEVVLQLEELRSKGFEPYAYKWDRTHSAH
ncbi:hypothetical protein LguiB_027174 [Lonicera macranthoides]